MQTAFTFEPMERTDADRKAAQKSRSGLRQWERRNKRALAIIAAQQETLDALREARRKASK